MRFVLSRKEEYLDGFDKQYLDMLGYSLKSVEKQLDLVDGPPRHQKGRSVKTDDVVFVHCCCEQGNLLSKPVEGQGLKVIDITKEKDFTNPDTAKDIIKQIKRSRRCFLLLFTVHGWFDVAVFELRASQEKRLE